MLKDTNIVEKSKALVWAQFQDYGVGELKILDTYLSRINARNPDSSLVTFTKKEYAELMGIDPNIRTTQLKTYTTSLLRNIVTIDFQDEGYVQYPLFSKAECRYDEKVGQVTISIKCHEELKAAFFDITKDGYVRYQLKNVISLKSQFSVRLYSMLKAMPFGWTVSVDELRTKLGATSPTYSEFKRFNTMVLKKAISEINDVTDITVSAESIRKGRAVSAIKFSVDLKEQHLLSKEQSMEFHDDEEPAEEEREYISDPNDPLGIFIDLLPQHFTRDQVEAIRTAAMSHAPYELFSIHERDLWMHDYIRAKIMLMKAQAKPVHKNAQFSWLNKAVTQDWE